MHFQLKIRIFLFCFLVFGPKSYATSISDSLVEGLECSNLSQEKIYQKIRPPAFSSYFHLPIYNWSFSAGPYDLAACWSLAHAQRSFFYLARWGVQNPGYLSDQIFNTLEILRGSSPYAHASDQQIFDFPLKGTPLVQYREITWTLSSVFWQSLEKGVEQSFANNQKLFRNFKTEIEFYQKRRFNDFIRNIKYIIGDGSRSVSQNRKTRERILQNLELHQLPLLLLRPKRVSQHVVIAKSFKLLPSGDTEIKVYDSNHPDQDQILIYNATENRFFAPGIVQGLPDVEEPSAPLGVFIVDDEDHRWIGSVLLKHYVTLCSQEKKRRP